MSPRLVHLFAALLPVLSAQADTVIATYEAAADVPVTAAAYTATGSTVSFTLHFAPATGTELMVVKNTGLDFIHGTFTGLAQGQVVVLSFGGVAYRFAANYYGGTGNDLVLVWAATRPFGWGDNTLGKLGNNSTDPSSLPVPVIATGVLAGKTVVALAQSNHSLALCADGTLAGWGMNFEGQIGDGTQTNRHVPTAVTTTGTVLEGKTIVAIAAGQTHSLALCSDGTLAAWGSNGAGRLGDSTEISRYLPVAVVTTGTPLATRTVVAIAAGVYHSMALCSDGTVVTWGDNDVGQLGTSSSTQSHVPTAVTTTGTALADKSVVAIAAGAKHNLALCSDGTLAAWGLNNTGQIGDGNTGFGQRYSAVAVTITGTPLEGRTITGIAAGGGHSLALCSDGTVAAWGSNYYGGVGDGTNVDRSVPTAVTTTGTVLADRKVVGIAAGYLHSLAVCSDGTAVSWGRNGESQLGDGTATTRYTAVAVDTSTMPLGAHVTHLYRAHSTDGALVLVASPPGPDITVFEGNGTGGNERQNNAQAFAFGVTAVGASSGVQTFTLKNIGTSNLTGLAFSKAGSQPADFTLGTLGATTLAPDATTTFTVKFTPKAAGTRNAVIQIASNDVDENPFMIPVTGSTPVPEIAVFNGSGAVPGNEIEDNWGVDQFAPALIGGSTTQVFTIQNIGTASLTGLALSKVGTNPGDFILGTLGKTSLAPAATMTFTVTFAPAGPGVRAAEIRIASNDADENPFRIPVSGNEQPVVWTGAHTFGWGYNGIGEVGDGTKTHRQQPVKVNGALTGRTVMAISAGSEHSLALCSDGGVAAWGSNFSGQLGDGTGNSKLVPVGVGGGALAGKSVKAIAAGYDHSLALCTDGTLTAWGSNAYGQLGGNPAAQRGAPVLVNTTGTALEGKTVTAIAAGYLHNLALCSDGKVVGWGFNESGQLGDGTYTSRLTAVAVVTAGTPLAGRKVVAIAAGEDHSLALCSDGTLVSWGGNGQGQRGDNTTLLGSVTKPVAVTRTGTVLAGRTVVAIAAGEYHSLALCSDGTVAAWGDDGYGAAGNGSNGSSRVGIPTAVTTAGTPLAGKKVRAIAAGEWFSMAVCADGTLAAWGYNAYGQVGDNSTTNRFVPVAVLPSVALTAGEHFVSVFSGASASHAFAIAAPPLAATAPEIAVFEGDGTSGPELQDNTDSFDFADTLAGTSGSVQTFTIQNTGAGVLTGIAVTKNGTASTQFVVDATSLSSALSPSATTTFTVQFMPTSGGLKTAALHVSSNDADEPVFDIALTGTGIAVVVPVVKTLAITDLAFDGATLNGSVDAVGSVRDVFFDYGPTTAYGMSIAATPAMVNDSVATDVSASIAGLPPHKTCHYRVRATGALGSATGADLSFTPANRAPAVTGETLAVLPGAVVVIPVLANDTDPDGDTLSIASFKQPATGGSVTRAGNTLVFTASATFPDAGTTFDYTVSDGFGKTTTGTVSLTKGTCSLDMPSIPKLSAGITYPVTVTATGAWSVSEALSWVSVTPLSGTGNGTVSVTLLPNTAKTERHGTITIGGQLHAITQSGVVTPILPALGAASYMAVVSGYFSLPIPTTNPPVTYVVTDTPPGLAISHATGVISGIPTSGGTYHLTVKASNAAGGSNTLDFEIEVQALPLGTVGAFHGFIERHSLLNGNLGSRFELNTTSTGSFTGKVITGVTTKSIAGRLIASTADVNHPRCLVAVPGTSATLDVKLDHAGSSLSGSLASDALTTTPVKAWRNSWKAPNVAIAFKGLHNFSLEQPDTDASLPQGFGYGSFTVKESTGALTATGLLADGTSFTTITFVGQDGQVLLYQPLYGNLGSFAGKVTIAAADHAITGAPSWLKPAPAPAFKDTTYRPGFGPISLTAEGGAYVPPLPGKVVMDLDNTKNGNAKLDFGAGGLAALQEPDLIFSIRNFDLTLAGSKHTLTIPPYNSALMPNPNPGKVMLTVLTPSTGAFSGGFTIPGATAVLNRTVTYQGLIVKHVTAGLQGTGYFLLPQLPGTGETLLTSPKNSGRVVLKAAP